MSKLRSPLTLISLVILTLYLGQFCASWLIPIYAAKLGVVPSTYGFIVLANLLAASILSIPFGSLSDRVGRVRMIVAGALVGASACVALSLASEQYAIMAAYAFVGVGHAAYGPVSSAYPADIAKTGKVGRNVSITSTTRQLASSGAPLMAGLVAGLIGFSTSFLMSAALLVCGAVVAAILLPEIRPHRAHSSSTKTDAPRSMLAVTGDLGILGALIGLFAFNLCSSTFSSFTSYLLASKGTAISLISIFSFVSIIGNITSRLLVGFVIERTNSKSPLILTGLAIGAVVLFVASFLPPFAVVVGLGFALGIGSGLVFITSNTIVAERASATTRGFALGVFNTVQYGASGIGPAVAGLMVSTFSYTAAFATAASVAACGLIVCLFLFARTWRSPRP